MKNLEVWLALEPVAPNGRPRKVGSQVVVTRNLLMDAMTDEEALGLLPDEASTVGRVVAEGVAVTPRSKTHRVWYRVALPAWVGAEG